MALQCLQDDNFTHLDTPMAEILVKICVEVEDLIPEIRFWYVGLPYLFATYKLHKKKYRLITSATCCTFLGFVSIITQDLKIILYELWIWCGEQAKNIFKFT